MPEIIAIIGRSGSGKTTLISKILPLLAKRGIRTGTIKQTHHRVELDTPKKDSFIHRESGSLKTALLTPDQFALYGNLEISGLRNFADTYFSDMDLVIAEGFKNENVLKMEVIREGLNKTPVHKEMNFKIQAVITDMEIQKIKEEIDQDVKILNLNRPEEVLELVLQLI